MNTYKLWKPTAISLSQEPDRQRHKHFSSSSHHKNPDARPAGKDDAKLRSARGYVSDGPPTSSQTLAPTYPPPVTPSLATVSKASHNQHPPTQASQGHPANMSQKIPLPAPSLSQEAHPATAERHVDPTYDSRATSQRAATATDKKALVSPDPVRRSDDHRHKSSRHRSRTVPPATLESAEPQPASIWPLSSSFLKKVSPDGREKDRDQSRTKARDEPKPTSKSKERGRAERIQEQASRDQREQSTRYEEEQRRYKEERRREKERRKEEERRRDDSHHEQKVEQKVKDDHPQRATRHQERRGEVKDGSAPLQFLGKDPRLARIKDSDESDNSLMKPQGSIRPRRHRQRDHTTPVAAVPSVLRQSTYPTNPAPVPTGQPENGPSSHPNESRQAATLGQPSNVTLSTSNDKYSAKPHKGSPSQNLTVPYPPGYAVSASDSEHVSKREHVSCRNMSTGGQCKRFISGQNMSKMVGQ
ncbi:hypothetical protein H4582DRAFT_556805 [Lactarius indigo]|nr:hypothetical protein H4582DRAFT_556805 [Lactarius indigo]